jgi:hypothetical protein
MPIFQIDSLIDGLSHTGVLCRRGTLACDVDETLRPYYERWLCNRDGFVKVDDSSIDYIGIEEVMRMGPFFDIFCLYKTYALLIQTETLTNSCHVILNIYSGVEK